MQIICKWNYRQNWELLITTGHLTWSPPTLRKSSPDVMASDLFSLPKSIFLSSCRRSWCAGPPSRWLGALKGTLCLPRVDISETSEQEYICVLWTHGIIYPWCKINDLPWAFLWLATGRWSSSSVLVLLNEVRARLCRPSISVTTDPTGKALLWRLLSAGLRRISPDPGQFGSVATAVKHCSLFLWSRSLTNSCLLRSRRSSKSSKEGIMVLRFGSNYRYYYYTQNKHLNQSSVIITCTPSEQHPWKKRASKNHIKQPILI